MTVDRIAALPGALAESSVSSVRLTADSQPQYANTPSSSPLVSAAPPSPKGFSHDTENGIESSDEVSWATFTIATTAKTSSATTWATIRPFWSRAETSVPKTQIAVITMMSSTARRAPARCSPPRSRGRR